VDKWLFLGIFSKKKLIFEKYVFILDVDKSISGAVKIFF
jgi:hypothetical protein